MAAASSLKEYLKRYESKDEEDEKKLKKKKMKPKPAANGVLVVDEDPVWQKPVILDEEDDGNDSPDDKPLVDEDIEVKRMRRLEQIRLRRAQNAIAEDGSGWVSLSPKRASSVNPNSDISPPRRQRARNDTPSPELRQRPADSGREKADLSPQQEANVFALKSDLSPLRRRANNDTPSPEPRLKPEREDTDLLPQHKRRAHNDTPSPEPRFKPTKEDSDLSLPQKQRARKDTPSPEPRLKRAREVTDFSRPWKRRARNDMPSSEPRPARKDADLSPPRRQMTRNNTSDRGLKSKPTREDTDLLPSQKHRSKDDTPSPVHRLKPRPTREDVDLSPPRKQRARNNSSSPQPVLKPVRTDVDLLPQRQRQRYHPPSSAPDISPPRRSRPPTSEDHVRKKFDSLVSPEHDLSPPRKHGKDDLSPPRKDRKELAGTASFKESRKTGLISGKDISEEISKTKRDDWLRFKEMDPSMSGQGAEPVFRDKNTGKRISKEDYQKSLQKVEEKPKEKPLEWGKGLAQKREAEARLKELEIEKDKPFARTRDDPELDDMLKERLRWGDPMAHLVKKKYSEPVLRDLGDSEKMKESGFIIPQGIPSHSWIKRGLDAAPNRYGIRPGRHWDGVDRSNGFEKKMFKRSNEKQATEREAYLWSVSDM